MEFIFLTLVILKGWVEKGFMTHSSMSQDYHKIKNYSHQQWWKKKVNVTPNLLMSTTALFTGSPWRKSQGDIDPGSLGAKVKTRLHVIMGAPFLRPQGAHLPHHHFEQPRQMALLPEPSNDSSHNSNTATSIFPPAKLLCLVYWLYNKNIRRQFTIKQSVSECMNCQPGWKK